MDEVKTENNKNNKRKKIAIVTFVILFSVSAVILFFYLSYKATHITTDDAFVEGKIHTIAPKVSGTVKAIFVSDNQSVKRDDLLVELDTADYGVKANEALSALNAEKAKFSELKAKIKAAKANLELQEANLKQAGMDIKRAETLYQKGAIPKEKYEKTKTAYDVSVAQVNVAREEFKQTELSIASQLSLITQKESRLKAEELNLSYTKIFAPSDGRITKKSVEIGNQVQAGQPIMAVVPLDNIWIVANYKETQLEKIKPGQKVEIKVDSYPSKTFYGKVDSIMAGTGAMFSLFPPENATGNYVKVVQRIPVKILLDRDTDRQHILRIGMSVEPTIIIE
ncbi:MAG: HlyD family secretion protein [Thermodesulfovibrio sp.]|nr:HlyD family secretion protein [Thermodesulfovibrio sp.]